MSIQAYQRVSELLGLSLLFGSALLILSLVSYDPTDASFSVATSSQIHANLAGRIGALSSDVLYQLLGWSALCVPVPFLLLGYRWLRRRHLEDPFLKLFCAVSGLISLSAAFSIVPLPIRPDVNFAPGGILGVMLAHYLTSLLNGPGALLFLATVLILSLVAGTTFSVNRLLGWFGSYNWNLFRTVREHWSAWSQERRQKKEVASWSKKTESRMAQPMPRKMTWDGVKSEDEPPPETIQEAIPQADSEIIATTVPPAIPATVPEAEPDSGSDAVAVPVAAVPEESTRIDRPPQTASATYTLPPLDYLEENLVKRKVDEADLIQRAHILATKCAEFGVLGQVLQIHPGPVVTTFEFKPDPGIKYSRVTNLSDDLCLALKAESVRIERISGKNTVGIEVPNSDRQIIHLREILSSASFHQMESPLALGFGKTIHGANYVADLSRMPHLLIAGATGSGKSVALNCVVCSILYKASPEEVRFIMIDPKRLELGLYADIPHLMAPIVTEPKKAANALNWAVGEMEQRYRTLAQAGVRDIGEYNKLVTEDPDRSEADPLPYVVVIVDELADLMLTTGKEVETAVTRLAQMARAIGIHLILATQRPSVDVITGLIKANFPSRISFRVSSKIDSRTILDGNGAEQLLGMGDMLVLSPGTSRLVRAHGAWVSVKEINRLTSFIKDQGNPEYREEILAGDEEENEPGAVGGVSPAEDTLFDEAARLVVATGKASTSLLQRRLRIGYGRAARLLDIMEHEGIISPPDGSKARDILVAPNYFEEVDNRLRTAVRAASEKRLPAQERGACEERRRVSRAELGSSLPAWFVLSRRERTDLPSKKRTRTSSRRASISPNARKRAPRMTPLQPSGGVFQAPVSKVTIRRKNTGRPEGRPSQWATGKSPLHTTFYFLNVCHRMGSVHG